MAKFLIVEARFYDHLNDLLIAGAVAALESEGHKYEVVTVPGAVTGLDDTGCWPLTLEWTRRPICQSCAKIRPPASWTAFVIGFQASTCSPDQMPGAKGQPSPCRDTPTPSLIISPAVARWR